MPYKEGIVIGIEAKERLPIRMRPETKENIEMWYKADDCRSRNEFIEKAVNFYSNYLMLEHSEDLLPDAVLSAISGRLGMLEKRLSAQSFEYAVELDLLIGVLADAFEYDREDLQKRRAQSIQNVKATNGRIRLEDRLTSWRD